MSTGILLEGFDGFNTGITDISSKTGFGAANPGDISATTSHTGTHSYRNTSYGAGSRDTWTFPTTISPLYLSCYIKPPAMESSFPGVGGGWGFLGFGNASDMQTLFYIKNVSGTERVMAALWSATEIATSTNVFPMDGAWHLIEIYILPKNTAVGSIIVNVDGVEFLNLTNVKTCNTGTNENFSDISLSCIASTSGAITYFDDMYISDTTWPAASIINAVIPNAVGNYSEFTKSANTYNWENVDDQYFSSVDYNTSSADGQRDSYFCEAVSESPVAIEIDVFCTGITSSSTIQIFTRRGGVDYDLPSQVVTTGSDKIIFNVLTTDPATGIAWTVNNFNATEFGVLKVSGGDIRVYSVKVQVLAEVVSSITGTLSKTLDDITVVSTGTVQIQDILSEVLDNVTITATGTVKITGTLSKTLDDVFSETSGESISIFPDISPNYVCTDIAMFSTLKVQFREDIKIEQRLSLNDNVKWSFKLHWGLLSIAEKEILQQFFIAKRGSYEAFTWYHFQPSQVVGTDDVNYTCIKTHNSDDTNKPITGGSYGNYWTQSGYNGTVWKIGYNYKYEFTVRFKMDIGNFGAFSQNLWNFNEIELIECIK